MDTTLSARRFRDRDTAPTCNFDGAGGVVISQGYTVSRWHSRAVHVIAGLTRQSKASHKQASELQSPRASPVCGTLCAGDFVWRKNLYIRAELWSFA